MNKKFKTNKIKHEILSDDFAVKVQGKNYKKTKRIKHFMPKEYTTRQRIIALWYYFVGLLTWNPIFNWVYYKIVLPFKEYKEREEYERKYYKYIIGGFIKSEEATNNEVMIEVTDEELIKIKSLVEFNQVI